MQRTYGSGPEWPFRNRYSIFVPGANFELPSVERVRRVFEQPPVVPPIGTALALAEPLRSAAFRS